MFFLSALHRSHFIFPVILSIILAGIFFLSGQGTAVGQAITPAITLGPTLNVVAGNGLIGYTGDGGLALNAEVSTAANVVVDGAGNYYFADNSASVVRKVAAGTGIITRYAGTGTRGYSGDGGPASQAEVNFIQDLAIDQAGNLYIGDGDNYNVRKVDAATGIISTVTSLPGAVPPFSMGVSLAVDSSGNLYFVSGDISKSQSFEVQELSASTGRLSVVAGTGTAGYSGDGGPATSAELSGSLTIAVDSMGNLYIADGQNQRVRKVNVATGIITTVAGDGVAGYSGDGGPAVSAELDYPQYLAFDTAGNLYISDYGNDVIRELNAANGTITTVVGNGKQGEVGIGGVATSAELEYVTGLAISPTGNIYFTETAPGSDYSYVFAVLPRTSITFSATLVGGSSMLTVPLDVNVSGTSITGISAPVSEGGKQEYVIGTASCAFNAPLAAGTVCDVPVTFQPAYAGERPVPLQVATAAATFNFGMTGMGLGPQVVLTPGVVTTIAGNGQKGFSGNGGAATNAEFYAPTDLAVDNAGNVYIVDNGNDQIRMVSAATGTVTNVAGSATPGSPALNAPDGIALDAAGNLYIADQFNGIIRERSSNTGAITVVAGNGTQGFSGDGGSAINAELNNPTGVAVDAAGNLYISDTDNARIRRVDASTGVITTIAGNGTSAESGDGGPAIHAELYSPGKLTLDSQGDLFFVDTAGTNLPGATVREIAAGTGIITTVAGTGSPGYSGDGGIATSAQLNGPFGIAVDSAGDLYIADDGNNVIRKVDAATGIIHTIAGNGTLGDTGDGGPSNQAAMVSGSIALDGAGNLYFANSYQGNVSYDTVREINVTSGLLDFASTPVGVTSSDSPQTAMAANIGNEQLGFTYPGAGTNPTLSSNSFTFGNNGTCPQLNSSSSFQKLTAGDSCTLMVSFTPTASGTINGTAVIADNALNRATATQTIALNGTGTGSGTGGGSGGTTGDFALAISPSSQAVNPGGTATFTVTVSGMGGFSNAVALAATGLPAGATLNFNPASVTLSGVAISGVTTARAVLTITTTQNQALAVPYSAPRRGQNNLLEYGFLLVPLPLLGVARFRKWLKLFPSAIVVIFLGVLSLGALSGITACANIGLELQQQSYTITVTGTSGNLQHSANTTLTLNTYTPIRYK